MKHRKQIEIGLCSDKTEKKKNTRISQKWVFGTQETKSIYQSFTDVLGATKQVVARCMHGSTPTDDARCALMSEFPSDFAKEKKP